MSGGEITWHADPTVAAIAVLGRHAAEVWGNGDADDSYSWCVFPVGAAGTFKATPAASFEAAKAAAEGALRAATSTEAQS